MVTIYRGPRNRILRTDNDWEGEQEFEDLLLPNDTYFHGRNQADTADLDLFKINAANEIEAGIGTMNWGGSPVQKAASESESLSGIVRRFISKSGIPDNIATTFARVSINNSGGVSDGGGAYAIFIRGVVSTYRSSIAKNHYNAAKSIAATFAREQRWNDIGLGANSAVLEIAESAVATVNGTQETIGAVTITVVESSEADQDLRVQIDFGGSETDAAGISALIEVLYFGAGSGPPTISEQ